MHSSRISLQKTRAVRIKKNSLTTLETLCGPAAEKNRVSLRHCVRPLLGYDMADVQSGVQLFNMKQKESELVFHSVPF
jgi:hypothetical protein